MPEEKRTGRRTSAGSKRNLESAAAIIAAATDLLAREGYGAFSMDKVAREAAAGKPTIYRWWKSKSDLLVDVWKGVELQFEAATNDIRSDVSNYTLAVFRALRCGAAAEAARGIVAEAQIDRSTSNNLTEVLFDLLTAPIGRMVFSFGENNPRQMIADVDIAVSQRAWFSAAIIHLLLGPTEFSEEYIAAVVDGTLVHLSITDSDDVTSEVL